MNVRMLFGWGITIYAIVHLVWAGLVIHGIAGTFVAHVLMLATLITVTVIATRELRFQHERDIAPYAWGWMIMIISLDAVFSVPSVGWGLYTDWNVWVGYLLVLFLPFVTTFLLKKNYADHS